MRLVPDPGAEAAPTPETEVPVACSASEAARLELPVLDTHLTTTTLPLLAKLPPLPPSSPPAIRIPPHPGVHVYQAVVGLKVVARSASSEEVNRVLRATTRSSTSV